MLDALDDRSHTSHIIDRGKMTRGVLRPSSDRVRPISGNTSKSRTCFAHVTKSIAVIRVGWCDGNEIETASVVRTFVQNLVKRRAPEGAAERYPRTIHFNVLPSRFPLSLPAHRVQLLFRGTSGSDIVRATVSLPRSYFTALKHT